MITYIVDDKKYMVSYSELRERYHEFINLSDEEFIIKIPEAIHFATFIAWFKELGLEATCGDKGIIHQLIHLWLEKQGKCAECSGSLNELRDHFKLILRLD